MDTEKYKPQIEKAINRYARKRSHEDKEDLRQECRLALLERAIPLDALADEDTRRAHVYVTARACIVDWLRQQAPSNVISTAEPGIQYAAEQASAIEDDPSDFIDAQMLEKLPTTERKVLEYWFGIAGRPELSVDRIATRLRLTVYAVRTARTRGLEKLRQMLKGKCCAKI